MLPGLIDAHVHLAFDASTDVVTSIGAVDDAQLLTQMAQAARRALRSGITTVRDLGDRGFLTLALRKQLDASGDLGPEIVASGPPITVRGGHCHFLGGVADGPQALRAAVRERAERGCEVVKVMVSGGQLTPGSASHESQYDLADLRLIVAEAHGLGMTAAAHVHCPGSVANAVKAGFDTLEHVTFLTEDGVAADPATMEAIVESGVVVSATVGHVPGKGQLPPVIARSVGAVIENWARLHRDGARIVPGTDAGIAPRKPHDVLPYGLAALTGLGMTNLEVLRAATSVAAAACGLTGRKGRLAPGPMPIWSPSAATRSTTSAPFMTSSRLFVPVAGGADQITGTDLAENAVDEASVSRCTEEDGHGGRAGGCQAGRGSGARLAPFLGGGDPCTATGCAADSCRFHGGQSARADPAGLR
ncbi:MAG TPA: amidohydrolase family protein [Pseudonocardiaceae bacterium]|nr:amidohydrolase family protein [Pseudonocardiaceae bacterium]